MTLKKFREVTKDLPENTLLITPAPDHSYRRILSAEVGTAVYNQRYGFYEDYGDKINHEESKQDKRCNVIIVD
jgi:hypothetical protein